MSYAFEQASSLPKIHPIYSPSRLNSIMAALMTCPFSFFLEFRVHGREFTFDSAAHDGIKVFSQTKKCWNLPKRAKHRFMKSLLRSSSPKSRQGHIYFFFCFLAWPNPRPTAKGKCRQDDCFPPRKNSAMAWQNECIDLTPRFASTPVLLHSSRMIEFRIATAALAVLAEPDAPVTRTLELYHRSGSMA